MWLCARAHTHSHPAWWVAVSTHIVAFVFGVQHSVHPTQRRYVFKQNGLVFHSAESIKPSFIIQNLSVSFRKWRAGWKRRQERKWPNMLVKTLSYSSCVVETRSRKRDSGSSGLGSRPLPTINTFQRPPLLLLLSLLKAHTHTHRDTLERVDQRPVDVPTWKTKRENHHLNIVEFGSSLFQTGGGLIGNDDDASRLFFLCSLSE